MLNWWLYSPFRVITTICLFCHLSWLKPILNSVESKTLSGLFCYLFSNLEVLALRCILSNLCPWFISFISPSFLEPLSPTWSPPRYFGILCYLKPAGGHQAGELFDFLNIGVFRIIFVISKVDDYFIRKAHSKVIIFVHYIFQSLTGSNVRWNSLTTSSYFIFYAERHLTSSRKIMKHLDLKSRWGFNFVNRHLHG